MPKVNVKKHYDDYVPGVKMTSYPPGEHDVSQAVADNMDAAGVLEGSTARTKGDAVVEVPGKGQDAPKTDK